MDRTRPRQECAAAYPRRESNPQIPVPKTGAYANSATRAWVDRSGVGSGDSYYGSFVALTRETLARRIRGALYEAGVSPQDLAAATGMDPTRLAEALLEDRDFTSLQVALVAEHLGLSTLVLLADDD